MASYVRHKIIIRIRAAKHNSESFCSRNFFGLQLNRTIIKLPIFKDSQSIYSFLALRQKISFRFPIAANYSPFIHEITPPRSIYFFAIYNDFQVFKLSFRIIRTQSDKSICAEYRLRRSRF